MCGLRGSAARFIHQVVILLADIKWLRGIAELTFLAPEFELRDFPRLRLFGHGAFALRVLG